MILVNYFQQWGRKTFFKCAQQQTNYELFFPASGCDVYIQRFHQANDTSISTGYFFTEIAIFLLTNTMDV